MTECELCQRSAHHIYESHGCTMHLCDHCFGRYYVQDIYEKEVLRITKFTEDKDYGEALDLLQTILNEYSKYDYDGWLKSAIFSHQAFILAEQDKFGEAIERYRDRIKLGFQEPSEALVNQLALANVLYKANRTKEAILELERGLNAAQGPALPTALSLFILYAKISYQQGLDIPNSYRSLLKNVAEWWGIDIPLELSSNQSSLSSTVTAVGAAHKAAQSRYQSLRKRVHRMLEINSEERDIATILREYIDNESVGFYRHMAMKVLEEMK